ncbi:MAG: hypothetical protein KAT05_14775 [Spirochaetes bacterium]|nr:hypothetical protein [Spirochaetota bacterium]
MNKRKKNINTKPNIWELLENKPDKTFLLIIRGHLYIEYLLNEILQRTLKDPRAINIDKLGFYKKVTLLRAIGTISKEMKVYLQSFNEIRNKYAHDLKFQPDYQVAYKLAKEAQKAGIYFKDDRIFGIGQDAKEYYSIGAIFSDVIINTFQELLSNNHNIFSQSEIKELMVSKKDPTVLR